METRQRSTLDVRSRLDVILDRVPEMTGLQIKRDGLVFSRAKSLLGRVPDEQLDTLLEFSGDRYDRACRVMIAAIVHTVSTKPLVRISGFFEVSREEIKEMANRVTKPVNDEIITDWLDAFRAPRTTQGLTQPLPADATRKKPTEPRLKSLKKVKRTEEHKALYSSLEAILDDVPVKYCTEGALRGWAGKRTLKKARGFLGILEDEGSLVRQLGERSLAEEEHRAIIAALIRYTTRYYLSYSTISDAFGIEVAKLQEMHSDVIYPILTELAKRRISDYLAIQGVMLHDEPKSI